MCNAVDNIVLFEALIQDKVCKSCGMPAELDLPKLMTQEIVHEELGYQKPSSRWVLKQLTEEQLRRIIMHSCCPMGQGHLV